MKERDTGLKKILLIFFTIMLIVSCIPNQQKVWANSTDNLDIQASAAILIDASTGKILYEKNAEISLPIASMTKIMTEYLVMEAIETEKITWDQEVQVSDYAYQVSQNTSLSNVPLENGGKYTVRELYEAMAIYSANGATIALSELIAGSETNFIQMMSEKAEQLGLQNYKFVNSTGLNNSDLYGKHPKGTNADDENTMSAKDTALLAYTMLKKYPEVLEISSIEKKVFQEGKEYPVNMENWNWMLPGLVYGYEGVDGLKTGTTDAAGACFTGTATRNGKRVISVIMNAKTYKARFDETRKLFDFGLNQFATQEIVAAGAEIEAQKSLGISKGKEDQVSLETKEALSTVVQTGQTVEFDQEVKLDQALLTEEGKLLAPIKKGQVVGTVTFIPKDEADYGYIDGKILTVDLITTNAVEKAGWFSLTMQAIGSFFGNLWDKIMGLFS